MSRARDLSNDQANVGGSVAPVTAGKNFIINGGFDIWQRGTSFNVGNGWIYTADRWQSTEGSGTWTLARESTVVPNGSQYSLKLTSGGTTSGQIATLIETANVTPLAGKTVTISAQVAASTSISMGISLYYSTTVDDNISNTGTAISANSGGTATPTSTTFVTLSGTYAIPSTAKTLQVRINSTGNMTSGQIFYVGQVQLEIGSIATPFSRAGGTIQGELAACQRYYERWTGTDVERVAVGPAANSTTAYPTMYFKAPKRTQVSSVDYSLLKLFDGGTNYTATSCTIATGGINSATVTLGVASGLTAQRYYDLILNGSTGYLGFNAEL